MIGSNAVQATVASGLNVDVDAEGEIVGFDIDLVSQRLDLTTLETVQFSLRSTSTA